MFKTLTDTSKAAIFTVLVLILAVAAALTIKALGLTSLLWAIVWSSTPALATVIMLLVVTRDGRSRQGWRSLGLHRLGLRLWWIAIFGTLLITVVASAVVWLTPLASVVVPAFGGVSPIISWLVFQVIVLVLSLSEEIGIRGYLLPKLLPMGRKRALLVSGLVWATWHMPLIFLTSLLPVGNKLIAVPLFYATIIAASFYFGYLRIYSGSVWPSTIAHAVHNVAWGPMSMLTVTAYPVLVNYYLVGDFGILIAVGAAVAAVLVGRLVHPSTDEAQPGGHQAPRSTTTTRRRAQPQPPRPLMLGASMFETAVPAECLDLSTPGFFIRRRPLPPNSHRPDDRLDVGQWLSASSPREPGL
jgi:uncharacterized protein